MTSAPPSLPPSLCDIPLSLRQSTRATRMRLIVNGEGLLLVLPNKKSPSARQIERFLQDQQDWATHHWKRLQHQASKRAETNSFSGEDGCPLAYLGGWHPWQASAGEGRLSRYNEQDGILHFTMARQLKKDEWPWHVRRLAKRWYHEKMQQNIARHTPKLVAELGKQPTSFTLKDMSSLWGSCHPDGRITLNWRLIMAPEPVFYYVLVHELCHLRHPNHSAAFWQLVRQLDANAQPSRRWLKTEGWRLHQMF